MCRESSLHVRRLVRSVCTSVRLREEEGVDQGSSTCGRTRKIITQCVVRVVLEWFFVHVWYQGVLLCRGSCWLLCLVQQTRQGSWFDTDQGANCSWRVRVECLQRSVRKRGWAQSCQEGGTTCDCFGHRAGRDVNHLSNSVTDIFTWVSVFRQCKGKGKINGTNLASHVRTKDAGRGLWLRVQDTSRTCGFI